MNLFDFIENDQEPAADQVTTAAPCSHDPQARNAASLPGKTFTVGERPGQSRRSAAPTRAPRPEKLNFLKPCPVCQGTKFTHGSNGGFFCNNCQPDIEGRPVVATGNRQQPETVEGLPCAGCGKTTYTKIKNGYIFDDGTLVDGWHCGRENCHIKLLIGNKKADQRTKDQALAKPTREGSSQKKKRF